MVTSGDRKVEDGKVVQVLASQGRDILLRRTRRQNADPSTSVTVLAVSERTPSNGFKRLIREYELAEYLDGARALRLPELAHEDGQTTLILEDPGGELLSQLLDTPMEIQRFLRFAIVITAAVGKSSLDGATDVLEYCVSFGRRRVSLL